MAIRDLLAVVDTSDCDEQFVQDALSFAELHQARLTLLVLSVIPSPEYGNMYGPPFIVLRDFLGAVDAKQQRIAGWASRAGIEIRTVSDLPEGIYTSASVHARYADLVLFGPQDAYGYPLIRRQVIESVLFESGRPVLVLPREHKPRPIGRFAIGWNASREATHALREAMLFAAPNAKVEVRVLDGKPSDKGHGSDPGADIAHHLARHGFAATVHAVAVDEGSDAEALVRAARGQGAQLLALGAYGHSRLREMILGGVTRDLLNGAPLPLLFAH